MSIQDRIPKSRITLRYPTKIQGEKRNVELPLRIMVLGDLSLGSSRDCKVTIEDRETRNITKNNLASIMKDMKMVVNLNVENKIHYKQNPSINITLPIEDLESFQPYKVAQNVPIINTLLCIKKLLLELQSMIDNKKMFRKNLADLIENKQALQLLKTRLQKYIGLKLPTVGNCTDI